MDAAQMPAAPVALAERRLARLARLAGRALGARGAQLAVAGQTAAWGEQGPPESLCAMVSASGRRLLLDDVARLGSRSPAVAEAGSFAGVPVALDAAVVGTLCVADRAGRRWSDDDVAVLSDLAATAASELELAQATSSEHGLRRELGRSGALLDSVLWTAPVALGFFDTELRYSRVNAALAEINGLPAEAHIGRTVPELLPGLTVNVSRQLRQVLDSGEPMLGVEVSGETPAQPGVARHWLVSYYPVGTADGEVFAIGAVAVEISDRKQAEQERARLLAAERRARAASEQAAARLAALQSITAQLSVVETLEDIAAVVAGPVVEQLGLRAAALLLDDDEHLLVVAATDPSTARPGELVAASDPVAGAVRARRIRPWHRGQRPSAVLPRDVSSAVFVPLVVRGRPTGALALGWPRGAIVAPKDADRLFAALGDQLAQAVERAGLRAAEQVAQRRLAFLAEASRVLSASLDVDTIMRNLARLAVAEIADACTVSMAGDRGLRLVAAAHVDPGFEPLLWQPAAGREGPAAQGEAIVADLEPAAGDRLGHRSMMAAPLRARDEIIGVLTLYQGPSRRRFSPAELTWLEDLAARAGTALDNARLYRDRAHVARTLQRSLLPPANPAIPGLQVAARYHPVSEGSKVGGDFYDVFPVGRERWGVVMGDVSGKGVAAASLTALSRYTVRAAALHLERPSAVLETLNRAIIDGDFDERFCTIVYCLVHEDDGVASVRLSRGGHPPPLLVSADGVVREVGEPGTAIGLLPEPDLVDTEVTLGPGDTLVLYTDGVLDARSSDGIWGEDLVESVLATAAGGEADEVAEALSRVVLDLPDGGARDDIAILVLRVPADQRVGPSLEQVLPPEPVAAARARGMLREWLDDGPRDDDVLLVATELIANAARVARSAVALRTWRTPNAVILEVTDDGEGFAPHTPAAARCRPSRPSPAAGCSSSPPWSTTSRSPRPRPAPPSAAASS